MYNLFVSNLLNLNQQELEEFVVSLGMKKFYGKQLFNWLHKKIVRDLNEVTNLSLKDRELLTEKAYIPFFSYNNENGFAHLEAQEQENMINCRSAAFVLLKDHIIFNETNITPDRKLDNNNRFQLSGEEQLHYDLLFANIENSNTDSSEVLAQKVMEYWDMAGVEFPESRIQFIMAYADTENGIQNFHTGVAIYDDNCIWMLEKADPIHPYQLSRFDNQEQLIDYMKNRVSEVEYAAIFSNDTCLLKK